MLGKHVCRQISAVVMLQLFEGKLVSHKLGFDKWGLTLISTGYDNILINVESNFIYTAHLKTTKVDQSALQS